MSTLDLIGVVVLLVVLYACICGVMLCAIPNRYVDKADVYTYAVIERLVRKHRARGYDRRADARQWMWAVVIFLVAWPFIPVYVVGVWIRMATDKLAFGVGGKVRVFLRDFFGKA